MEKEDTRIDVLVRRVARMDRDLGRVTKVVRRQMLVNILLGVVLLMALWR